MALPAPSPTAALEVAPVVTSEPFALVYASDREGTGALYLLDEDGVEQRLTDPADTSAWQPSARRDGGPILFTGRRDGQSDIAMVSPEGGEVEWLTAHPADDHSPAWSWDGSLIAWVSERNGRGQIWLMEPGDEAGAQPLPGEYAEYRTRHPAWTPDGTLVFSGMPEHGVDELYRYDPAMGAVEQLTELPLKASQPAVNAAGEIVFVGWEDNYPWRGLYHLAPDGNPRALWETTEAIGDPAWSVDGSWILFTRWTEDGNGHDLWALEWGSDEPRRVTQGWGWQADAEPWPLSSGDRPPEHFLPEAAVHASPYILGFNIANLANIYLSQDVGFGWGKGFASWERAEPQPGEYWWVDIDNTVNRFDEAGLQLFLRVDRTPEWARPEGTIGSHPPENLDDFARFLETLAARYRGRVAAYELWNEPNLAFEWGGQPPDPERYVEMLRVARPALQRGDPDARLVVGALAVTGESNEYAMNDLEWMRRFYTALGDETPRPYDAFSTHPYGFGQPPDFPPEAGPGLRYVEVQRALMEEHDDMSPLWLTELGYARHTPAWDLGEHEHWTVNDEQQAQYLVETLDWIAEHYPYVEAVFPFNLDFSVVDWYGAGEQMRAYAILDSARRPLPAYTALREWATRQD
jgi:Tol biopolymer transport system component